MTWVAVPEIMTARELLRYLPIVERLLRAIVSRWRRLRQGALRGHFDGFRGSTVAGWAQDGSDPSRRVIVELFEGRALVASVAAEVHRPDLLAAGIGDGRYGFEFPIPRDLIDGRRHRLRLLVDRRFDLTRGGVEFSEHPPQPITLCSETLQGDAQPVSEGSPAASHPGRVVPTPDLSKIDFPLVFPCCEAPAVSIVIPVHNKIELTCHALASLLRHLPSCSFEVIVVDDGSTDETLTIKERVHGLTVVRHEQAQGFVSSCNDGAKLARGHYVVMLNNDVEVTPGWLDELLWPFSNLERVGLVGAQLVYPDGRLQEAGGIVWGTGAAWNYGRGGDPMEPRYNYTRDVDYASGACIALPKSLWDQLEGFDPLFAPAYYEDTDLAFRVRNKGYRTLCAPLAKVIHFEGASAGTDTGAGMKRFQAINEPKFRERWRDCFAAHGVETKAPDLEKDRGLARRALVLDALTPTPDKDAGSYAAIQEMRLLQALGFKVSFAAENLLHAGEYSKALQRSGIECLHTPYFRSYREILEQRGGEFDLVYITRYYVADKAIDLARTFAPQAKIVLNNADLHFLREIRAAMASACDAQMQAAKATRELELAAMRKADLVLSYNETEHAVIHSHILGETPVALCPWVVESPATVPDFQHRMDIAFLGGYGHRPNVEAVNYFVDQVMPLIRKRLPGVRLLVFGSNVPPSIEALAADDVVIKGFVTDVKEVYDTCRVFVAPLLSGAGIKGKVVGAFAHGVPCVLSPIAAEGTGVRNRIDAIVATDPEEWCEAVAELHEDANAWRAVSDSSRAFAAQRFSFETGLELMRSAIQLAGVSVAQRVRAVAANGGECAP